ANAARMGMADLRDPLVQLSVYDTGGDPAKAANAAAEAIAGGAKLILGPLFGSSAKAIASTAAANNVNVLSFSTDSNIAGGPIYVSGFLPEKAAARMMSFAGNRGLEALGIYYPQTAVGELALRGAQAGAGPRLVASTAYPRSQQGISQTSGNFAAQVRSAGAQGLMIADSGQALGLIAQTLAPLGVTNDRYRFLGLGQWNSKQTLTFEELRGAWFPAPDPNAMSAFVGRYQERYGSAPPALAVLGYDVVQIAGQLLASARASGSKDPFGRAALTRPQGFRGAVGPIRFDPNGLGERAMVILEVSTGAFNIVDPAPAVFGAGS
ncbi:MAG: penicillin-binding protein activator, partial [Pseudomonadota bacterium]